MEERSTALALFTSGNQVAMVLGNQIGAAFCKSRFGWPAGFYFPGFFSFKKDIFKVIFFWECSPYCGSSCGRLWRRMRLRTARRCPWRKDRYTIHRPWRESQVGEGLDVFFVNYSNFLGYGREAEKTTPYSSIPSRKNLESTFVRQTKRAYVGRRS